jgi:predicted AAA+ superfamily ATPase
MMEPIGRASALRDLSEFLNSKGTTAGFCYLRGRRRVGKSTLLTQFEQANQENVFYFMGRLDENSAHAMQRCAKAWDHFTHEENLTRLRPGALTWDEFFNAVASFGKKHTNPILLAFDEIQWIAREKSGFLGSLKEHWIQLEPLENIRIILCGSSNKFFQQMTGGEEKLIRGLKTRADIWLQPLTLSEIKTHYKLPFSDEELVLAYTFFGGVPYYWNQFDPSLFFVQSVNRSCFTSSSIFLEEYMEMLNLEFQKNSIRTLTQILSQVKGNGVTAAHIADRARLAHSTVGDLLEKLENYNLVFRKTPLFSKPKEIQRGALYYIKDFYLNFFFRVLFKSRSKIARNRAEAQIFSQILDTSPNHLFITDYTGPMFELLVQHVLETSVSRSEAIFQKLCLNQIEFEVGFHWDKSSQFDLILHNTSDRVFRFIECKWTKDAGQINHCIESFKKRTESFEFKIQKVLCLNHEPGKATLTKAKNHGVIIITPTDLI